MPLNFLDDYGMQHPSADQPRAVLDNAFDDSAIEIDERGFDPANNLCGSSLNRTGAVLRSAPRPAVARQQALARLDRTAVPQETLSNSEASIFVNFRSDIQEASLKT